MYQPSHNTDHPAKINMSCFSSQTLCALSRLHTVMLGVLPCQKKSRLQSTLYGSAALLEVELRQLMSQLSTMNKIKMCIRDMRSYCSIASVSQ